MKKKLLILLVSILVLFTSCDLFNAREPQPKMYLIACGMGYQDSVINAALTNPLSDCRAVVEQFVELADAAGSAYEILWYQDDYHLVPGCLSDSFDRFTFTHMENDKPNQMAILDVGDEFYQDLDTSAEIFFDGYIRKMWSTLPEENDILLFYYTGHGTYPIVRNDADKNVNPGTGEDAVHRMDYAGPVLHYGTVLNKDTLKYEKTYLYFDYGRIFRYLDEYRCRQLFISDSCYSGATIENMYTDNNEYGYTFTFKEDYDNNGARFDEKEPLNLIHFMSDAWEHTFNGIYAGKPRRICINASHFSQQAMDRDQWQYDPGISNFGGLTFRLLDYLGYDVVEKKAMPPEHLYGKVVSATDIFHGIYDNISKKLNLTSTPNITRSSFDMAIFDFRHKRR